MLDSLREELMAEEGIMMSGTSNRNPFDFDASNINRDSNQRINKPNVLEANKDQRQKRLFDYDPTNIDGYQVADLSMSM